MTPARYLAPLTPGFRRQLAPMIALGVLRRLLDLVGLAAMLPLVVVILHPASVEGNSAMATLFAAVGLDSVARFGLVLGIFALVLVPVKSLFTVWLGDIQNRWQLTLYRHYSRLMYDHYHSRGVLFLRRTYSSALAFHINGACYGYAMSVVGTIVGAVAELIVTVLLLALVVWLAPVATGLLLAVLVPVFVLYFAVVGGRLKRVGAAGYEARREQSRTVQESLRGHVSLAVAGSLGRLADQFERGLAEISATDRRAAVYRQIPSLVVQLCIALALVVLLVAGTGGGSPVEMFILFGFAAVRIMPSVLSLAGSWNTLQNNRHLVDIVSEAAPDTLDAAAADEEPADPMPFERTIELRDVTFAFEGGAPVIDRLSFTVPRGATVGVTGASGAGKTTLFNLLSGFYFPRSGAVLVDGTALTPANRRSWHRVVGYVEQDVFILNDTVARNVAFSDPRPDLRRVRRALRRVGLEAWADGLDHGLDTVLGEGGGTVSGGERQRIGIARALYDLPQVLLLDEATSALDAPTEAGIVALLQKLSADGLTLFIISHRRTALHHCDTIIEL